MQGSRIGFPFDQKGEQRLKKFLAFAGVDEVDLYGFQLNILQQYFEVSHRNLLTTLEYESQRSDSFVQDIQSLQVGLCQISNDDILPHQPGIARLAFPANKRELTRTTFRKIKSFDVLGPVIGTHAKTLVCFPNQALFVFLSLQVDVDLLLPGSGSYGREF